MFRWSKTRIERSISGKAVRAFRTARQIAADHAIDGRTWVMNPVIFGMAAGIMLGYLFRAVETFDMYFEENAVPCASIGVGSKGGIGNLYVGDKRIFFGMARMHAQNLADALRVHIREISSDFAYSVIRTGGPAGRILRDVGFVRLSGGGVRRFRIDLRPTPFSPPWICGRWPFGRALELWMFSGSGENIGYRVFPFERVAREARWADR